MQTKPIKILIVTDSPKVHTGLAETCRLVYKRLLEKYPNQYELHQLGWFNTSEGPETVSWPIYNTNLINNNGRMELDQSDRYGHRTFEGIRSKVQPDIVWTNGDLWCFDHLLQSPNRNAYRLICYYTIDGTPYHGGWFDKNKSEWGQKLIQSDRLVVLTPWGEDVLHKSCPELKNKPIDVIYHPVDVNRFKVLSETEKMIYRRNIFASNIPLDAFILGWIGRNQFRKQNHKMWEVLRYITKGEYISCNDCGRYTCFEYDHAARAPRKIGTLMKYESNYNYTFCWYCRSQNITKGEPKSDIYLWLHMNPTDPGWNPQLHSRMWDVEDRCIATGDLSSCKGIPPEKLAQLISTWDGMLYLSGGEGFGIPAFESMMCGVPLIYTNYSSHADFAKYGGLPVRVDFIPEMAFGIHRSIADTNHAVEQCMWAYNNRKEFKDLGLKGRAFALTKTLDTIVDAWHNMFQEEMKKPLPINSHEKIYSQLV